LGRTHTFSDFSRSFLICHGRFLAYIAFLTPCFC
jgi:hypothetical protein